MYKSRYTTVQELQHNIKWVAHERHRPRNSKLVISYYSYALRESWSQSQPTGQAQAGCTLNGSITGPTRRKTSIYTHVHTYGQFRVATWPNPHVFELYVLWEETRVHVASVHRKGTHGSTWRSTSGSSCCEATIVTTTPLCHLSLRANHTQTNARHDTTHCLRLHMSSWMSSIHSLAETSSERKCKDTCENCISIQQRQTLSSPPLKRLPKYQGEKNRGPGVSRVLNHWSFPALITRSRAKARTI